MAEHDIAGMGQKLWVDDLEYTKRESEDVETIRISPSAVENMLTCPLRGVLDSANGQSLGNASLAHVGTLVHQIAEETEEPDLDMMRARLDELWAVFDFGTDLADQQLYERAVGMVTKLHQYLTENPATEQRELYARVERDGLVVSGKSIGWNFLIWILLLCVLLISKLENHLRVKKMRIGFHSC